MYTNHWISKAVIWIEWRRPDQLKLGAIASLIYSLSQSRYCYYSVNASQVNAMQRNSAQPDSTHPTSWSPSMFPDALVHMCHSFIFANLSFASQRQCRLLWESNRNRRHFVLYQVTQICPILTFTVACSISKFINNLMILLPAGRKTLNSICANIAYFSHYIGSISSHRKQMELFWGKGNPTKY